MIAGYPNVHARLRLTQRIASAVREHELAIWLRDTRFRVRALTGCRLPELLADATDPRQLGALGRTIEDLMDRESARHGPGDPAPATELFGDRRTGVAWIAPPTRMRAPPATLAVIAEQILARDKLDGLHRGTRSIRLGRDTTTYHGVVTVTDGGRAYHNEVTRAVAGPYLLIDAARCTDGAELSYLREVTVLAEGVVTEADVTPPAT